VELAQGAAFRVAASVTWRGWSSAAADLSTGQTARDAWELGGGFEIGGPGAAFGLPLRLGLRYATLPFTPTSDQPHELTLAGGTGLSMAAGRVRLDLTVERAARDGGGASERAWLFLLGMQVAP
jgi:hypothetical protein